jgi:hypothetical protein
MNLVLYTKNEHLNDYFKKSLPPSLSKIFFNQEGPLRSYLKKLTVPTQVILDRDTYQEDLKNLFQKAQVHHVICVTTHVTFEHAIDFIRKGSILIAWSDLKYSDWWWNRSMIEFSKKRIHELKAQSIIFIPYTPVAKIRHFLESSVWRLFFEQKPHLLILDGNDSFEKNNQLLDVFMSTMKRNNSDIPLAISLKNFHEISPLHFRQLLSIYKNHESSFSFLRFFIYFDSSYSNFDRAFDNCINYVSSSLFRVDYKKLERMSDQLFETSQTEALYHHFNHHLVIESIELAWNSLAS